MMLRRSLLGLSAAAIGTACAASEVRDYPYPFSHVVTFASDVDQQTPLYGRVLHAQVNERIGLPVSDSLWVIARGGAGNSAFFTRLSQLNDQPSGVHAHPVYGLLLREWHRGNYDHFHSWQDDATPQLRNVFSPGIALSSDRVTIRLPAARSTAGAQTRAHALTPQHLRMLFDAPPPADLSMVLRAPGRTQLAIPREQLARIGASASEPSGARYVEALLDVPLGMGTPLPADAPEADQITELELRAPSCAKKGCAARLVAVERDNFSRHTVLRQLPLLQSWNIRPALLTSHGGWTYHQNFGEPAAAFAQPGLAAGAPNILTTATSRANDRTSHAYHADLLKHLGVVAVWPLLWGKWPLANHSWTEPPPPLTSRIEGLYTIGKAIPHEVSAPRDYADLRTALLRYDPLSEQLDLTKYLCLGSVFCYQGAQGAALELLVDLALLRIRNGHRTDLLWHTHFGTSNLDPTRRPSPLTTLHAAIGRAMHRLAQHHYGVGTGAGAASRIWVPPAGVLVRYRTMLANARNHVKVERSASRVTIAPWVDPVTGSPVPEPAAGTRDLHGLTVYVEDAGAATVWLGNAPVHTFTRNPPDRQGRASVTIVDNNSPTVILDEVKPAQIGTVQVSGGSLLHAASESGAAYGKRFLRLRATSSSAAVSFQPWQLDLWNTSHLHFAYRKRAAGAHAMQGSMYIELEMSNGQRIEIRESDPRQSTATPFNGWSFPATPSAAEWRYVTLDSAQMTFVSKPGDEVEQTWPLPVGPVKTVRFGLRGARPGEILDLDGLMALRPNSNGEAQDATKLVAGQVTYADGTPVADVTVVAAAEAGRRLRTATNKHGYYFFSGVARGSIIEVAAMINGERCNPTRGRAIEIRKNEAELDINLAACRQHNQRRQAPTFAP
ncbi:MAG: hypothetical protein IT531_15810 [Burkholderiales bacterium]|nr:hypothetical protein [Burkholderiales bacterium]